MQIIITKFDGLKKDQYCDLLARLDMGCNPSLGEPDISCATCPAHKCCTVQDDMYRIYLKHVRMPQD